MSKEIQVMTMDELKVLIREVVTEMIAADKATDDGLYHGKERIDQPRPTE